MSFLESYDFLLTIRHLTLGQIDVWKSKEDHSLAYSRILPSDFPKELLSARSSWTNQYVVQLLAAELHKTGANNFISAYFEFYELNLQGYLCQSKQRLPESEILCLFYQVLLGAMFLTEKREPFNLDTGNIFYSDGKIKLVEGKSPLNPITQLGQVLFELCTRESCQAIFDEQQLNLRYFEFFLAELSAAYSNLVTTLLRDLLHPESKATMGQIHASLEPFEEKILSQQPIGPKFNHKTRAQKAVSQYKELLQRLDPRFV